MDAPVLFPFPMLESVAKGKNVTLQLILRISPTELSSAAGVPAGITYLGDCRTHLEKDMLAIERPLLE